MTRHAPSCEVGSVYGVCNCPYEYKPSPPPPRPQWSLLPASIASVVDVLTWSEQHKHGNGSWRSKTALHHYDAAMRHLHAYRTGEKQDPDTKQHPIAHAVARLLFALAIEQTNKGEPGR